LASAWPPCSVRPIGPPQPTFVVADDDPALPLLEVPLGLLDTPLAFAWWPRGNEAALRLAAEGLVHAAAVCLRGQPGERRTGPGAPFVRRGTEVIAFCSWREGLVLSPGAGRRHHGRRRSAAGGPARGEPGTPCRSAADNST